MRLSERLRAQYPEEMTIVLQHQFWDLKVTDDGFEVGLSFGGVPEQLTVPFEAIKGFVDPSVQFSLQFEEVGEDDRRKPAPTPTTPKSPRTSRRRPAANAAGPASARRPAPAAAEPEPPEAKPARPKGGAEVVRLDRFRKK